MENDFSCPICGNTDERYIGFKNGEKYCRLCVSLRGKKATRQSAHYKNVVFNLGYHLSDEQKYISNQLVANFKEKKNTFVSAVCGAGKTEIVLDVIAYAISVGCTVGFALPRRDVAIELYFRFKSIFSDLSLTLVHGGRTKKLIGDLIILTTHQLFRYEKFFDLLILDEVDAFPYKGNMLLEATFKKSLKGNFIMMSATPENTFLLDFGKRGGKVLSLNNRYHKYPLPVPQIFVRARPLLIFTLRNAMVRMLKVGKQVLIFTPTISICEESFRAISKTLRAKGAFVHSKCSDRNEIINSFRDKTISYLFSTAVLERGVTISDLQVIVFNSDHSIYDEYSLVQISGRVGRKKNAPTGEVLFIGNKKTEAMVKAVESIEESNKDLQNMFWGY